VAANDGDLLVCWICTFDFRDEAGGSNNVKSGYTEQAFGIVDAFGLVNLSADWDGGVNLGDHTESVSDADAWDRIWQTGFEMTRRFASGAASAAALAKSRTIEALVLNRSVLHMSLLLLSKSAVFPSIPSRVMPGFRGTPAGMRTTSAPVKASLSPDGVGSYPLTLLLVLI
jgi:hypothetical protein